MSSIAHLVPLVPNPKQERLTIPALLGALAVVRGPSKAAIPPTPHTGVYYARGL